LKDKEFAYLLRRSENTERQIVQWYRENVDKSTHLCNPPNKEFDIYCAPIGHVEVKEDLLANDTGFYAFEFEDSNGKPSGIAATIAGESVIVDKELVIFLKTISLLFLIKECDNKRIIRMGYTTKEGKRALGYLIPRGYLVHSPYVKIVNRWWPWR